MVNLNKVFGLVLFVKNQSVWQLIENSVLLLKKPYDLLLFEKVDDQGLYIYVIESEWNKEHQEGNYTVINNNLFCPRLLLQDYNDAYSVDKIPELRPRQVYVQTCLDNKANQ